MIKLNRLSSTDSQFEASLNALLAFESTQDEAVTETVTRILADVRKGGDDALLDYTRRFDQLEIAVIADIELPKSEWQQSLQRL
ncbi:MAG TPA: histidinol dehydrogenase, partial [Nitrosomonas nitrosa]|nr:histidinol dehydrogenase [Nitrosomonas nitrosa]